MGASAYVGRVGGLAVALGVGAAVVTGHGIAWATETESNSTASDHSTSEGSSNDDTSTPPSSPSSPSTPTETNTDEQTDVNETDVEVTDGADLSYEDADREETVDEETTGSDGPSEEVTDDDPDTTENTTTVPERNNDSTAPESFTAATGSNSTPDPDVDDKTVSDFGDDDDGADNQRFSTLAAEEPQTQTFRMTMAQDNVPITFTAPQAEAEPPSLQRMVVNVLSSLSAGLSALASTLPGAPIWSPFVMAVLGLGARRETTEPVTSLARAVASVPAAALTLTDMAAAAITSTFPGTTRKPVYVSANTRWIEYVTGAGNLNNTTARFGIGGTDLGIMWDNGTPDNPATTTVDEHQVLIAFGDTFSVAPRSGVWRFNTLFRTPDDKLSDGLYVPDGVPVNAQVLPPNLAHFSGSPMERTKWSDPILPSPGDPVHPPYAVGNEVTIIPTAGVSAPYNNAYGARQYMSFMSVRSWDSNGRWTTNYSGVAYSDDNGQTWTIAPTSIRSAATGRSTVPFVSGNQNFQQGAFVKPPEGSAEDAQGWVYSYGTPSGRAGTLYLSRVQEKDILETAKYQYWNGSGWVSNNPGAATPILPAKTTSFFGLFKTTKYPSVSEMSVQYNPYLKKYVMLYGDSSNKIVMRTADSPQGVWSEPKTLVGAWTLGGKYAPYIHPWSGTDNLADSESQYLYWNMSTWGNYQVRLMRTDLTKV